MAIFEKTDDIFMPVRSYVENKVYNTLGMYSHGNFWPRFEIPILTVLIASLVYTSLSTALGEEVSRFVFLLAVVVSAWLDIFKSGILAAVFSVLVMFFYSIGFENITSVVRLPEIVDLLVFFAVALLVSFLISSLRWAVLRKQEVFKRLEESKLKLERANSRIVNILESISDGFVFFDKNENFGYLNKRAEKFFGRERKDLLGKNLWKEFPQLKGTLFSKKFKKAIKANKSIRFEYLSPRTSHWFLMSFFPAKEGEVLYIADITPRKNLEIKQEEFIAVASHELKTPLTSIKLLIQMLAKKFKEDGRDDGSAEEISAVEDQIDRLTHLINTLLDVSKLKEKKMSLEKNVFMLDDLVRETIEDIQKLTENHKIILDLEKGVQIMADDERIKQVLTNLVNNAVKYSPGEEKVEVKLWIDHGEAIVSVKDYGQGIPQENQKKTFF
jgi:PAS domain S-box-containing protein